MNDENQPPDQRIVRRCAALGLTYQTAMRFSVADDKNDSHQALLRILDLDFQTYEVKTYRRPKRWLWMAAQTSSVSYGGTLDEDILYAILCGAEVLADHQAHICHFLDEAPIQLVVMSVEEAAHRSGLKIDRIWERIERLANSHSNIRRTVWTQRHQ